jgi:pimeloyl-ACP methyl ester carboxylesterase
MQMKRLVASLFGITCLTFASAWAFAAPQVMDIDWKDAARERTLPLKVRVPEGLDKVPLVIFSHGLGGSREGGKAWGEHWSANGYLVVHVQHPGSDESLWKGAGEGLPKQRLMRGATAEQLLGRVDDVRFLLDEFTKQQSKADAPAWVKRADLSRVAMTGHSFGARTTMALAGERYPGPIKTLADSRISAFIAFSPATQGLKRTWPERYGEMTKPFFTVTGTIDGDVLGAGSNPKNRAALFDAQGAGDKFRVVFDGGDHSVFNGGDLREAQWINRITGETHESTTAATAQVIRQQTGVLTLKFLDAYVKGDARAKAWLRDDSKSALGEAGEWSAR